MNKRRVIIGLSIVVVLIIIMITSCSGGESVTDVTPSASVTSIKTLRPTRTQTLIRTSTPTTTIEPNNYSVELFELPDIFYSSDGKTVSLSYYDHIEILDTKTFKILNKSISEKYAITNIFNISPDGKKYVVGIDDFGGNISILNTETNEIDQIGSGTYSVSNVQFSADSEYAVYKISPNFIHDCSWAILRSFSKSGKGGGFPYNPDDGCTEFQRITSPGISPDGKYAAEGVKDFGKTSLYIWNVEDISIRHEIQNLPNMVISVAFHPDSDELASLGEDGHIDLWNPDTGEKIGFIPSIVNNAASIRYNDEGSIIIISTSSNVQYEYNLDSGKSTKILETNVLSPVERYLLENNHIRDAVFAQFMSSPDGNTYAFLTGSLQIWDAKTKTILHKLYEDETLKNSNLSYSMDSSRVAVITPNGNVYIWDVVSGEKIQEWQNEKRSDFKPYFEYKNSSTYSFGESQQMGIAFSTDGSQIALNNGIHIEIWDIETGKMDKKLSPSSPAAYPTKLSFSEDGKNIYAVLNENQDVAIWDIETGKFVERFNLSAPNPESPTPIALLGQYFARENYDGHEYYIEIWNLETKHVIKTNSFPEHLYGYSFTQNQEYLSAYFQDQLYLWDTKTGEQISIPIKYSPGMPNGLNYNGSEYFHYKWMPESVTISFIDLSEYSHQSLIKKIDTPTPTPNVYDENGFYIGNEDEYYDHSSDTYATQIVKPLDVPVLSSDAISKENVNDLIRQSTVGHGEILKTKWSYDGLHIHVISSTGYYLLDSTTLSIVEERPFPNLNVTGGTILADRIIQICGTTTDGMVEVRDALSGELLLETIGSGKAEISPNGKWLVYELSFGNMGLWNLQTNMPDHSMQVNIANVHPIFSPDSNSVTIIVAEDTIEIWDIPSGIQKQTINFDYTVNEVKFSENAQYLIISQDRQAHFWNLSKQEFYKEIDFANKLEGDPEYYGQDVVHSVAINQTFTELAVNTEGRMIWHYDISTDKKTGTVSGTDSIIHSMTYSPDDSQLLSVDENGRLTLWETRFWKKVATSNDFVGEILGTTWLQDGSMTAWSANRAITFNPEIGGMINNVFIQESKIMDISVDGNYIAGNTPHRISMYDLKSGTFLRRLPIETDFYFSTSVWGDHLRTQFYGANFSTDGKHFIAYGSGGIWMIDPVSGSVVSVPEMNYITCKGAISPDGEFVVYSYNEYMQGPCMIDFDTAEFVVSMEPAPVMMYSAEIYKQYLFSPDKKWVAELRQYYDQPALLDIHPTTTGRLTKQTTLGYEEPTLMAFNPDGSLVAVGFKNGEVKIVDFESDEVIATIQAYNAPITAISFSQHGKQLISADDCGHINVWGLE